MNVYNAIVVCGRDEHLLPWHVEHVDKLGVKMQRCCYFGTPFRSSAPLWTDNPHPTHVVSAVELYENLPLKTFEIFAHALQFDWTHLLKTDVNSYPTFVDWGLVEQCHLVGFCSQYPAGRIGHRGKVAQSVLNAPFTGPMPQVWCGGPAYVASRRLVEKVVERGPWYARGFAYEDQMVSLVACENGWPPADGVGYFSDGQEQRHA